MACVVGDGVGWGRIGVAALCGAGSEATAGFGAAGFGATAACFGSFLGANADCFTSFFGAGLGFADSGFTTGFTAGLTTGFSGGGGLSSISDCFSSSCMGRSSVFGSRLAGGGFWSKTSGTWGTLDSVGGGVDEVIDGIGGNSSEVDKSLGSTNCDKEPYRDRGAVGSGGWTKSSAGLMN